MNNFFNLVSKVSLNKYFQKYAIVLAFILILFPAVKDTIAVGFFPMHDDLQVMRQLIMDKCFNDGQIPCRWSVDLGYGFGYPIFNFYPPLPYYIGQVVHWVGFSFVDTIKVVVILNFLVSGLTMYLLAKEFWGRAGGLLAATFYIYAPYHAVDIYVRAAMDESWALSFLPLVFWSIYKVIVEKNKIYIPILALSVSFLLLSHNPITMIFIPAAAVWTLFWLIVNKSWKPIFKLVVGGVWALMLAAFFTLPVLFEQQYVHVETLVEGYFNYLAHFATLHEMFVSQFWGYGDSRFGPIDGFSYQIGHLHLLAILAALVVAILLVKKKPKVSAMLIIFLGIAGYGAFMAHQKSSFIWSAFAPLQFLQFPWRFLTIVIFATSFLAGSMVYLTNLVPIRNLRNFIVIVLVLTTVLFYKDYFHWKDHWPWVNDQYKFSGELWRLQITSGIFDYLPKWAPLPPPYPPNGDSEVLADAGSSQTVFKNSIKQDYSVNMQQPGVFQINTFYFPGWKYFINNKQVDINPSIDLDKEVGRPRFVLPPGQYEISAKLTDTPIHSLGNTLTLIGWLGIALVFIKFKFKMPLKIG